MCATVAVLLASPGPIANAQGGSGGCNPFRVVSASGDLYCFARALNQQLPLTVPVTADALLGAEVFGQRVVGTPLDPNYALSTGFVTFSQGDLFGVDCLGRGTAQAAAGTYAFARTDIYVSATMATDGVRRVRGQWSMHADGISGLQFRLTRAGVAGTILQVDVSAYITPETSAGSFEFVLPDASYQLVVYGDVQANSSFMNPDDGAYGGALWASCFPLEDISGDGVTNAQDLGAILAAWGPVPPYHPADLDQDGQVGAFDLAQVLAAWE